MDARLVQVVKRELVGESPNEHGDSQTGKHEQPERDDPISWQLFHSEWGLGNQLCQLSTAEHLL